MRQVRVFDLMMAAEWVMRVPEDRRPEAAQMLVQHARWADLYRKRTGKRHRDWGDGTLAGAVEACGGPMRVQTLAVERLVPVLSALARPYPEAQLTQSVAARSSSRRLGGMSSPQSLQ